MIKIKIFKYLYEKFIFRKAKISNMENINNDKIGRKGKTFVGKSWNPLKKIYRLISWESPSNFVEIKVLKIFQWIFGHMILIVAKNESCIYPEEQEGILMQKDLKD